MFGKKKEELSENKVPVYTVQTLPEKYTIIQTVWAKTGKVYSDNHEAILDELGIAGYEAGADAVIAPIFHFHGTSTAGSIAAYGTAIKYVD